MRLGISFVFNNKCTFICKCYVLCTVCCVYEMKNNQLWQTCRIQIKANLLHINLIFMVANHCLFLCNWFIRENFCTCTNIAVVVFFVVVVAVVFVVRCVSIKLHGVFYWALHSMQTAVSCIDCGWLSSSLILTSSTIKLNHKSATHQPIVDGHTQREIERSLAIEWPVNMNNMI